MNIDNIRKIINKLPDVESDKTVYLSRVKTKERIRKIISKMRAKIIKKCEAEHWTISPDEVERVLDEMILNALEKQIPKKPKLDLSNPYCYIPDRFMCPECKTICSPRPPYCGGCGQSLDWSEVK